MPDPNEMLDTIDSALSNQPDSSDHAQPRPSTADDSMAAKMAILDQGINGQAPQPAQTSSDDDKGPTAGSTFTNFTNSFNRGISSVASIPHQLANLPMDVMLAPSYLIGKATGDQGMVDSTNKTLSDYDKRWNPFPSSDELNQDMSSVGAINPDIKPNSPIERAASGFGSGASAVPAIMLGGEAALAATPDIAPSLLYNRVWPTAREMFSSVIPKVESAGSDLVSGLWQTGKQMLMAGTAGAFGSTAEEAVPDKYKPLANMAGQLTAGGVMAGTEAATAKLMQMGGAQLENYISPMTQAGQQRIAGQTIQDASSMTPYDLRYNLATKPQEIVPGSKPTTAEQTGDVGLSNLTRQAETQNPVPFRQRTGEQEAARIAALKSTAPEDANTVHVGNYLRGQLKAIDDIGKSAVDKANASVQAASGDLKGSQTADQTGAGVRSDIEAQRAPAVADQTEAEHIAKGAQDQSLAQVGGTNRATQGEHGQALRQQMQEAADHSRAQLGKIWSAVDPTGKAALNVAETANGAKAISGDMASSAKPMSGEESAIFDHASSMPTVNSFKEISGLRSRITSEIAGLRGTQGNEQAVRRLSLLKGHLDDNLSNEAQRLGQADPDVVNRIGQVNDGFSEQAAAANLQDQVNAWRSARTSASQRPSGGEGAISTVSRAGPANSGSGVAGNAENAAGAASVSGTAPIDAELPARYNAAKSATVENAQKFKQGAVGTAIAPGRSGAQYRISDPAVMDRIWRGRPGDGHAIGELSNAIGADNATSAMRDYAAFDLRRTAVNPDGSVNPTKYQKWMSDHGEGLDAIGARSDFENIGKAQQAVDEVAARRAELEKSNPIRPGMTDADLFNRAWKAGDNGASGVRQFMTESGGTPEAVSNLEDGVTYSMKQAAMRPDGTLDTPKFHAWQKRYKSALSERPELSEKFSTLAKAQDTLDMASAKHTQAVQDFQKSAASHFLQNEDTTAAAGSALRDPQKFSELVKQVSGDEDAKAGLKRAVVDHMLSKAKSASPAPGQAEEGLKPQVFKDYLSKNRTSLSKLFTPEELGTMQNVASDIERTQAAANAPKLPGRSNTAQDLSAAPKDDTLLSHIIHEGGGALAGATTAGPIGGAVGAVGGLLFRGMRARGIASVNKLVTESMLDPQTARLLLSKVPAKGPTPYIINRLAQRLRMLSGTAVISQGNRNADSIQP